MTVATHRRSLLEGWDYAPDEDITLGEIESRRRPTAKAVADRLKADQYADRVVEEVEHLRGYGIEDVERLAAFVGKTPLTYERRVAPMLAPAPIPYADRMFRDGFDRLVESGEPFITDLLPLPEREWYAAWLVALARSHGRIRCVGPKPGGGKIWIGVAAAESAQEASE